MSASDEPPESADEARFLVRMSHRGRMVRVLVALALTVFGLIFPAPYIGWGWWMVLFAPAAVLLLFAGMEREGRRVVLVCALPTLAALILAAWSLVSFATRIGGAGILVEIGAWSLVASLAAGLLGRPPSGA